MTEPNAVWDAALEALPHRGYRRLLRQQGRLDVIEESRVVVIISDWWRPALQLRQQAIAEAFSQVLARPITVEFVGAPNPPPPPMVVPPLPPTNN